ncbi:MAG: radical SAM-associated putative lipoprotein [Bacteroidales bacterium]|nr:radical SAM-associated putative lipoprotein [Bacteroidales bacterium]
MVVAGIMSCDSSRSGHVNARGGGLSRGSSAAPTERVDNSNQDPEAQARAQAEAQAKAEAEARAKAESDAAARAAIEEETGKKMEPKKERRSSVNRRGGVNQRSSLARRRPGKEPVQQDRGEQLADNATPTTAAPAATAATEKKEPKKEVKESSEKSRKEPQGNRRSSLERKKAEEVSNVEEDNEELTEEPQAKEEEKEEYKVDFVVRGRVLSPTGRPIRGMQVVLLDHTTDVTVNNLNLGNSEVKARVLSSADTTDANGYFVVTTESVMSDYMRVFVRDIDGPSQGNYQNDVINISFTRFDLKDSGHGWRNGKAEKTITVRPKPRK